jgi:hypothetical protein
VPPPLFSSVEPPLSASTESCEHDQRPDGSSPPTTRKRVVVQPHTQIEPPTSHPQPPHRKNHTHEPRRFPAAHENGSHTRGGGVGEGGRQLRASQSSVLCCLLRQALYRSRYHRRYGRRVQRARFWRCWRLMVRAVSRTGQRLGSHSITTAFHSLNFRRAHHRAVARRFARAYAAVSPPVDRYLTSKLASAAHNPRRNHQPCGTETPFVTLLIIR